MESPARKHLFRGVFGLGVFLVVTAFFADYIEGRTTLFVIGAGVLGLVALGVAVVVNLGDIGDFLKVWWLGLALVLDGLLVMFFADTLGRPLGLEGVKLWLVLFGIMFAADGVWFLIWWRFFRPAFPAAAARAGAAANVAAVAKLGIVLLVIVNWFGANHVTRLIGSRDMTETEVYTLGDRTRQILDELDELPGRLSATYVDFGTNYQAMPGEEPLGNRGKDFLRQYGDYSSKIDVAVFNGFADMTKLEKRFRSLGLDSPDLGDKDTIVFTYLRPGEDEPNRKDVEVSFWTFMETSPLGTKQFKGEQHLTSAIQDVIYPRKKVYFLTGHGEHPLTGGGQVNFSEAAELTRKLALDTETLSLVGRGAVPDDADLIVIAGPQTPILDAERAAIESFLDSGGSLLLFVDPQGSLIEGREPRKIGLEDILAKYGIAPQTEFICMDYDIAVTSTSEGRPMKTRAVLTADYSFHKIVEDLSERKLPSRFMDVSPVLKEMPEDAEGLDVDELVYVRRNPGVPGLESLRSYGARLYPKRILEREDPRTDILDKRLPIAVAASKTRGEGENAVVSRVVVFGQSGFASTYGLNTRSRYYAPGNATLYANSVAWAIKREALLSIEPKTLETETVALSDLETRLARTVSVFMIPFFVLLFGLGVAWRRRR